MIPKRYIQEWSEHAPWNNPDQVEQDLLITRTLVALFSDAFLKDNIAFRGGTALHKLYLRPAPRYSEDIDLVQIKPGPIKPILKGIGKVINFFDEKRVIKQKQSNNTIVYRFNSEFNRGVRLKLKIEINCREHFQVFPLISLPFEISNTWFSSFAEITTYEVIELLGTKLRALYQRRKGRDLFDLYYASQKLKLNYEDLLHTYSEYMKFDSGAIPTQKQFLLNINEKEVHLDFHGDMEGLLRIGVSYNPKQAFEWLRDEIISRMI